MTDTCKTFCEVCGAAKEVSKDERGLANGQIRWAVYDGEIVPCEVVSDRTGGFEFYLMGMPDYFYVKLEAIGPVIKPPLSSDGFIMMHKDECQAPDPVIMNSPIWVRNINKYGNRPLTRPEMFILRYVDSKNL